MGVYSKNIAVIRGLKDGFSADGGALSGLVKAEKYGSRLKVEVSFVNFAPLTEGKYVTAVSDGKRVCLFDGGRFDGVSEVDTGAGFAALVCFVNGAVSPLASAICGSFASAIVGLREEIERQETNQKKEAAIYEDDALAEDNYYEYAQTDESGGTVCEDPQKTEDGRGVSADEAAACAGAGGEAVEDGAERIPLGRGECFYDKMKEEIERLFSSYPKEEQLERIVENSRWIKIRYGDERFYVFGVIGVEKPQYLCYGVPSRDSRRPPASLEGLASFIPASENGGYWVMYQDAATGASVAIDVQ